MGAKGRIRGGEFGQWGFSGLRQWFRMCKALRVGELRMEKVWRGSDGKAGGMTMIICAPGFCGSGAVMQAGRKGGGYDGWARW